MMIISSLFRDWKRYEIKNCEYEPPCAHRVGADWELVRPCVYKWEWDLGKYGFCHLQGYRWNGSTVPYLGQALCNITTLFECSLPHDLGYETQGGVRPFKIWQSNGTYVESELVNWFTNEPLSARPLSRARIDALMFAFALASRVPPGMDEEAYVGVYIGGQQAWNCEVPVIRSS